MEDPGVGQGIQSEFQRALTENAAALAMVEAMGPEAKEKLLAKVRRAHSRAELDEIVDSLVGWQRGHGPFQE